jgi:hypothetical protein
MSPYRYVLLVAVALLPMACGAPTSPAAPPRSTEESSGLWRGTSTRFQALVRNCPHPGLVTLQIWDDKFQYRWDAGTYIDATIQKDGSITGQGPGITLVGTYVPRRIEGDITNGNCGLHFTVVKKDG